MTLNCTKNKIIYTRHSCPYPHSIEIAKITRNKNY